jgi:phage FluMu protein Com
MKEVRCGQCSKLLALANFIELQIKCSRCRTLNHMKATEPPKIAESAFNGGTNVTTHHSVDRRQAQAR